MKITRIDADVVRRPYPVEVRPSWSPGRVWSAVATTVFRVHTDEGITGIGASTGSPKIATEILGPRLAGEDPFRIDYLTRVMRNGAGAGAIPVTCGIETALWDIVGKAANLPLYRLWGMHRNRVRAYASMVEVGTPEQRAEDALALLGQGYTAIKLRLHSPSIHEDIAQVAAVRAAVGDRMEIMVDANQAQEPGTPGAEDDLVWGFHRALATCRELADLGVRWLEEPLPRYDHDTLARLSAASDVPIAGGENNIDLHEFRWMIDRRCYDLIQPDALVCGGLSTLRRIATYAEMHHLPIAPHHGGNGLGVAAHLHLVGSLGNAGWIELLQEPGKFDTAHFQGILAEPLVPGADGFVTLPEGPGLGVELAEGI